MVEDRYLKDLILIIIKYYLKDPLLSNFENQNNNDRC